MTGAERDSLLEQVLSAYREQSSLAPFFGHPAWHDLPEADRETAFVATYALRSVEAALDGEGLSTTARSVLARIRGVQVR